MTHPNPPSYRRFGATTFHQRTRTITPLPAPGHPQPRSGLFLHGGAVAGHQNRLEIDSFAPCIAVVQTRADCRFWSPSAPCRAHAMASYGTTPCARADRENRQTVRHFNKCDSGPPRAPRPRPRCTAPTPPFPDFARTLAFRPQPSRKASAHRKHSCRLHFKQTQYTLLSVPPDRSPDNLAVISNRRTPPPYARHSAEIEGNSWRDTAVGRHSRHCPPPIRGTSCPNALLRASYSCRTLTPPCGKPAKCVGPPEGN